MLGRSQLTDDAVRWLPASVGSRQHGVPLLYLQGLVHSCESALASFAAWPALRGQAATCQPSDTSLRRAIGRINANSLANEIPTLPVQAAAASDQPGDVVTIAAVVTTSVVTR